jgi:lipopolysaccharide export system permease protein
MRILDRYIIKEVLGPFFFGIAAFSSIFIGTGTLFRIAQYITKYGASIMSVTKMFFYSLPSIVVLTFPMAMLLAALLSFGRLSGSSELTAMRSGGLSFYRLTAPVFIIAFAVSIFSAVFQELVVPAANTASNDILHNEIEKSTAPRTQDHIIIPDIKGEDMERLTYARTFDGEAKSMNGITLEEFAEGKLIRVENAERAVWQGDRWVMYNGVILDLNTSGGVERTMRFAEQNMPVTKNPTDISRQQKKPNEMTIKELKQHIRILKKEKVKSSEHEVELHQRLAIPMASFIFALIGTPLGLQPHRSSSSIGLGISIIIIFIYYAIMTVTTALGNGGVIAPFLAAWIPNIIGFIIGCVLIRRAAR